MQKAKGGAGGQVPPQKEREASGSKAASGFSAGSLMILLPVLWQGGGHAQD